nr:secernin-3-like [Leptinotarsa decemlineata]
MTQMVSYIGLNYFTRTNINRKCSNHIVNACRTSVIIFVCKYSSRRTRRKFIATIVLVIFGIGVTVVNFNFFGNNQFVERHYKSNILEKISAGYRNISNALTITTKIDRHSKGLLEYAKSKGLWDGQGEFNFREAFSGEKEPYGSRFLAGEKLLEKSTSTKSFKETDMFAILRDKESGICMTCDGIGSVTQGSQVSVLSRKKPSIHWFTATPDPSKSVFKPFVFTKNVVPSKHTQCSSSEDPHTLYSLHSEASKKGSYVQELLRNMESECVKELETVIEKDDQDLSELDELFKDCVETEVKFYR